MFPEDFVSLVPMLEFPNGRALNVSDYVGRDWLRLGHELFLHVALEGLDHVLIAEFQIGALHMCDREIPSLLLP
jgi:hypothetical protein